ncbi:MAG: MFS transporter, partial [Alphaproteobacteria bacterium]
FTLGTLLVVVSAALLAAESLGGLILGLALMTFAYACVEVTLSLYVLDHIPRHQLGRFEPTRIFVSAAPWTLGPWLGVYLQSKVADAAPYAIAGAAALALLALFWVIRFGENTVLQAMRRPPPNPVRYLRRFLAQPRLRLAWVLAAGRAAWWSMFFIYAPIFAVTSGLGAEGGGALVSLGAACMWSVPLWGWLGRRYGLRRLLLVGYALAGVLSLIAALLVSLPMLGAAMLLLAALGAEIIDGAGNTLFLRAVHPYERAEMTTVFVSYRDVAQLAPPAVFSVLLSLFSLPSVFIAGGLMMLGLSALTRHVPRSI